MPAKLTLEEFIEKSKTVHGDKYDYSKSVYKNNHEKIIVICPEHGEFKMRPSEHMNGQGCPVCKNETLSKKFSMGKNIFIERSKDIHGDKYDYSNVVYKNNRTKVEIICKEHGPFYQTPDKHLCGQGCPKCCKKNKKYTTEEFIDEARRIHGNKYDYSKTVYGKNDKEKVIIICPEHGEFKQAPVNHLSGQGCRYCAKGTVFNTKEFITAANLIHKNKYDYSKSVYKKSLEKVTIICPEHGEFEQYPAKHLNGQGCPICSKKFRKGEINLLEELKKHFPDKEIIHSYRNKQIFGKQEIDIFFPKYNIGVEFQGEQHFSPVDFGGYGLDIAKKIFLENKKRDIRKKEICNKNRIKLFYFSDSKKESFNGEKVYCDYKELISEIDTVIKKEEEKK